LHFVALADGRRRFKRVREMELREAIYPYWPRCAVLLKARSANQEFSPDARFNPTSLTNASTRTYARTIWPIPMIGIVIRSGLGVGEFS
jgi:hypothetical protein